MQAALAAGGPAPAADPRFARTLDTYLRFVRQIDRIAQSSGGRPRRAATRPGPGSGRTAKIPDADTHGAGDPAGPTREAARGLGLAPRPRSGGDPPGLVGPRAGPGPPGAVGGAGQWVPPNLARLPRRRVSSLPSLPAPPIDPLSWSWASGQSPTGRQ